MAAIGNKANERASVRFIVQKVHGHKSAATTTIYQDVTEQEVRQVASGDGHLVMQQSYLYQIFCYLCRPMKILVRQS